MNREQIIFEISQLLYLANSRYGKLGDIHPTIEEQKELYEQIYKLRKQLKYEKI